MTFNDAVKEIFDISIRPPVISWQIDVVSIILDHFWSVSRKFINWNLYGLYFLMSTLNLNDDIILLEIFFAYQRARFYFVFIPFSYISSPIMQLFSVISIIPFFSAILINANNITAIWICRQIKSCITSDVAYS